MVGDRGRAARTCARACVCVFNCERHATSHPLGSEQHGLSDPQGS